MARKVFISVLGTGFYGKCKYITDDFVSEEVRFIQKATIDYINKTSTFTSTDCCCFLLTEKARRDNWAKSITIRTNFSNNEEEYFGLEKEMEIFDTQIKTVDIPDGKNEEEMWEIFDSLYNIIEENDELYFDLTHGFRYLPMLVLVFSRYAKLLQNATVRHLSYGNFEARNRETNEAPIVDLMPLYILQEWNNAAANYLEFGNVNKLVQLCADELKPILRATQGGDVNAKSLNKYVNTLQEIIEDRQMCRGRKIIDSEEVATLKKLLINVESSVIKPFAPIFDKINSSLEIFKDKENITNGFHAAKWCFQNSLYQQSATILQESIVTLVCKEVGIENLYDINQRRYINDAFNSKDMNGEEAENVSCNNSEEELLINNIINNKYFVSLKELFRNLSDIRNDFNHAGMRNNPAGSKRIVIQLERILNSVFEKL